MFDIMEGIEGCHIYVDDILIWGETKEEHNARLERVLKRALKRAKESNLIFDTSKCKIEVREVKYQVQTISN